MRVLVVDDSRSARTMVASVLQKEGYQVDQAGSGEEAIEAIQSNDPYNLITLDWELGDTNGYDLCLKIRLIENEAKAEAPVIFITGKDTIESRTKGFEVGGVDFLSKDNLLAEIGIAVNRILKPSAVLDLKVLVVDDSMVFRKALSHTMRGIFSQIDTACDGVEAFEMIKEKPDYYDFLLTDHDMPNMNGTELTRKVRFELGLKGLPIVLVTATQDRNRILEFFGLGGTDCLTKPYIKEELHARVRAHIEKASLSTELKNTVNELKELNKEKDEFLATCSHDLKSPLGAIIGFTDFVMEDMEAGEAKDDLGRVLEAAKILGQLIDKISELHREQSSSKDLELEPLDLNDLVKNCVDISSALALRKGVSLKYKASSLLPKIMGSELDLTRVINNLVSNSLKFTEKGGAVEVVLKPMIDHIHVAVVDNGVGMSQETLDDLFVKFKVSKRGTMGEAGTGLGLMITKQIVEKHGGEINVESALGEGTSFSFDLKTAS